MRHWQQVICISAALLLQSSMAASAQASSPSNVVRACQPAHRVQECSEPDELGSRLKRDEQILRDWPALARYREDNARLGPAVGEKRVVFMGDSITDFWGRQHGQFFFGKPYINRGISGQITGQMLIRFRPDVIWLRPKVVVILAGTNDIWDNNTPAALLPIEDNLMSMTELAKANGIGVVLASVLPVCDAFDPQTPHRSPQRIIDLNAWMKAYAATNGLVYVDYYSAMLDEHGMLKQALTYDCVHPNDRGYAVMEPLANAAIETAFRDIRARSSRTRP